LTIKHISRIITNLLLKGCVWSPYLNVERNLRRARYCGTRRGGNSRRVFYRVLIAMILESKLI